MSRVFLAEDTALGRKIVVKVLPPELTAGVNVERFNREILLAAKLQHPHIVPLFRPASATGSLLRDAVHRGPRCASGCGTPASIPSPTRCDCCARWPRRWRMRIARRGAPRHKARNILLTDAHAVITDFGVAKALSTTIDGSSGLTSMGIAIGTPAYMSPEQASGDPGTDHRTDIYAFGLIAYELLTGHPPFAARSAQAMIAAHMTESPEPVTSRRPACHRRSPHSLCAARQGRCARKARSSCCVRWMTCRSTPPTGVRTGRRWRCPMVNTAGDAENEHSATGSPTNLSAP
jgi:serine/threonine-protein kinase